ncbi:MAG: hypothetical protein U1F36_10780 [Planctomycetota bacterium]
MSTHTDPSPLLKLAVPAILAALSALPLHAQTDWQQFGSFLPQPGGRNVFGFAYDSHRRVTIMFGGQVFGGTYSNETWQFDGNNWLQLTPPSSPPGVMTNIMAYDNARRRVVLFGGGNSFGYSTQTWEFDGTFWVQRNPAHHPSGRNGGACAYDARRERVVLFGGWNGARLGDTWEWDGTDWTQRSISGPSARSDNNMAYDEGRGRIVMYGGYNDVSGFLGDTWEYDGNAWTNVTPSINPGRLADPAITYDRGRGRIVMFGGSSSFALPHTNHTWEFDGTAWTDITAQLAHAPSGRWVANLCYDEARGRVVMFGGIDNFNQFPNDTWELVRPNVATAIPYGAGCAGTAGEPRIGIEGNAVPRVGTNLGVRLQSLPLAANTAVLLLVGFSSTQNAGVALPQPLTALGMPGCQLLTSIDLGVSGFASGGSISFAIPVPNQATLVGQHVYAQAIVVDPGANAGGMIASDGLDTRIGS